MNDDSTIPCTVDALCASACDALGYTAGSRESRAARVATEVVLRHVGELPAPACGGSPKEWKKQYKRRLKELRAACKPEFQEAAKFEFKDDLAKWGMVAAILLFVLGGPLLFAMVVFEAVFAWAIEKWLDGRSAPGMQVAARALAGV